MRLLSMSGWREFLLRWLSVGLLWWLAGMLLLSSHKLYQQGLIALFWLPGLLALLSFPEVRRAWWQPGVACLALFATWSACSVLWSEVPVPAKELKIFLYVGLAANAVLALAVLDAVRFWRALAMLGVLVGLYAWSALLVFYGWQDRPWSARVVGTGLANHPILAAQLFCVMGMVLLFLRDHLPGWLRGLPWFIALLGYLAFLLLSQSKGPWAAAFVTLLLLPLWCRGRRPLAALGVVCMALAAVYVFWPDVLLQRGLSFRPDLFAQALLKIGVHPWLGIGFDSPYTLPVPSLGVSYEHAHNLYLHLAVLLGLFGLLGWLLLQGWAALWAWRARGSVQGRLCLTLLCFSAVALFTDGVGPWLKPREEWFCIWLPLFLCLAGAALQRAADTQGLERT
ncbi:O-antigen ligase family protein [Pseudomonas sp. P3C3]